MDGRQLMEACGIFGFDFRQGTGPGVRLKEARRTASKLDKGG
jgi:hypothetical protein